MSTRCGKCGHIIKSVSADLLRQCLESGISVVAITYRLSDEGIGIHHPRFGKALKEKMDALGIGCEVHTGIPRGDDWIKLTMDFVKKHLGVK